MNLINFWNIFITSAKSPVFSHISATLSGLSTIRAFQAEKLLRDGFEEHQDLNTGTYFMFIGSFSFINHLFKYKVSCNFQQLLNRLNVISGTSSGFGMSLDLMVYAFIICIIFTFILVNEGLC